MQTPTDEVLRDAVRAAIDTGSLRRMARLTGLSPGCIRGFADGKRPFASTRGRLERWFVVDAALRSDGPLTVSMVEALLSLLLRGVSLAPGIRGVRAGACLYARRRRWLDLAEAPGPEGESEAGSATSVHSPPDQGHSLVSPE